MKTKTNAICNTDNVMKFTYLEDVALYKSGYKYFFSGKAINSVLRVIRYNIEGIHGNSNYLLFM